MDWLDKLKQYAPDIAAAIVSGGATLPALAVKSITDATGEAIDSDSGLAQYIESASPESMLKVKQANNAFKIRMRELDVELQSAELSDKANARSSHKHSIMPAIICCVLTIAVIAFGAALMAVSVPPENIRLIDTLFGAFLTAWLASVTYWVGTTRSSAEKDRINKK